MANKSLTDLTARTATADSDLLHINSGGTDYKQSKSDFIANLDKHITFGTSSSLSSQVDALASGRYFGFILSYGHQTETGMPLDSHFYVEVQKQDGNNIIVTAVSRGTIPRTFQMAKANSWGSWIEMPNRSEITSLNNSFTNGKLHNADHYFSNISVGSALYVDLGDIESVFGIPAGSYIVSAFIRGWSGNPGALSLVVSSNGKNLYLMCSATGTISSVTVRVWYCATN